MTVSIFRRRSFVVAGIFTVVAGMMVFSSCSRGGKSNVKGSSSDASGVQGVALKLSADSPQIGADVTLEIATEFAVADVQWSVFQVGSDQSLVPGGMCIASEVKKTVCSFEAEGDYLVQAKIKLLSGGFLALEKRFTVKTPNGLRNQDPIIVLKLSAGAKSATVATFQAEQVGDAVFPVGENIAFDLSSTRDDANASSALTYEMSFAEGAAFESVAVKFSKKFDTVGQRILQVRATDSQGNKTTKMFALYVSCGSNVPELVLNSNVISVNSTSNATFGGFNFHDYIAPNVRSSGGMGPYKYMWDFNGDGVYDTEWLASTELAYPVYSNHVNTRKVRVKVWDTQCQFVKVAEKDITIDWSSVHVAYADDADLAAGPKMPDYYYIQGQVKSTSAKIAGNASANVDFWGGDKAGAAYNPKRVYCQYARPKSGDREKTKTLPQGNFQVTSFERYLQPNSRSDNNQYKKDGLNHGISLTAKGIVDNWGSEVPVTKGMTQVSVIHPEVHFYTDRMSDETLERDFKNSQACEMKFVVQAIDDGTPCAPITFTQGNGQVKTVALSGQTYGARMWGTYTCPEMKDANNETVKIEDGAFFCEELKVDACVGCCCCCCCCGVPPIPQ